nr:hypothetical protein [uncultured Undibacterium sp.]
MEQQESTLKCEIVQVGFALCVASVPILEKRAGLWLRCFAVLKASVTPANALILCIVLMSFASDKAWLTFLAFSAIGSGLFWLARRKQGLSNGVESV